MFQTLWNDLYLNIGPSSDTVDDFWRMIWLEKVKVIVMVTSLQDEAGQVGWLIFYPAILFIPIKNHSLVQLK